MAFTARDTTRRTHLFDAACADLLTPDHFDFDELTGRMLHLGLPGTHAKLDVPWGDDPNGWVTILRAARAAGLTTNMEVMTIPVDDLRRVVTPCLAHLDHLVVNDYEVGALSGRETLDGSGVARVGEVEVAAREIAARGAMEVVVVHFPQGRRRRDPRRAGRPSAFGRLPRRPGRRGPMARATPSRRASSAPASPTGPSRTPWLSVTRPRPPRCARSTRTAPSTRPRPAWRWPPGSAGARRCPHDGPCARTGERPRSAVWAVSRHSNPHDADRAVAAKLNCHP